MCRSSNFNCALQPTIDVSDISVKNIPSLESLTSSLSNAFPYLNKSQTINASTSRKQRHHHIIVEHDYHDHANENEFMDERPARGGVATPFPIRLHKMLDQLMLDGHADVISWQPHGRCFVVRKPKEFKELLPVYFKLSKMSSFQRQLNLYGFQRLTRGRDKNGYYHEYFLRGKPALSHKIQRTKVKGTGVRARSNPTTEPHLWEMPWVGTDAASNHDMGHSDTGSVSSHEDHFESPAVSPLKKDASCNHPLAFSVPPLTGSFSTPLSSTAEPSPFMVPSWAQHQPLVQQQPLDTGATFSGNEHDIIMSFGGKRFHYLDPVEMAQEAQLRKRQVEACQQNDMEAFMTNLELDNLYSEIDEEAMDSDNTFMDMLERIIE